MVREGEKRKRREKQAEEREREGGKDGGSSKSPSDASMNRGSPVCIHMQKDHAKVVQVQCIMKTPKSASMH